MAFSQCALVSFGEIRKFVSINHSLKADDRMFLPENHRAGRGGKEFPTVAEIFKKPQMVLNVDIAIRVGCVRAVDIRDFLDVGRAVNDSATQDSKLLNCGGEIGPPAFQYVDSRVVVKI